MKINDFDSVLPVVGGQKTATFKAKLKAGKTRLYTWLYDNSGNELCCAYYVRARRLG